MTGSLKKQFAYLKFLLITLILFSHCCKVEESEFKELRTIPGDNKILIQWEFLSLSWASGYDGFSIIRSTDNKNWIDIISCYPIDNNLATYWSSRYGQFLDTTAENGQTYFYRVDLTGIEWGSTSEVVASIAKDGLPYPRPISPHYFYVSYVNDSSVIIIKWVPPPGCDGLYYVYSSSDSNSFNWIPYDFFDPYPLHNQLAIRNRRDASQEYYKFIALADGILSEPSKAILVEHKE